MKVLLVDPPWIIKSESNLWKRVGSCLPGMGLVYIAAVLEKEGHEVKYIDSTADGLSVEDFQEFFPSTGRNQGLQLALVSTSATESVSAIL